jgi:DNA polymerase V
MGIHGTRMINELKGIQQLDLETPAKKQSIATTRSFMEMIAEKEKLRERIETFAFSCAEKLRKQNSCCRVITVFIHTNRFRKELGEYKNGLSVVLPNPSNSSIVLAKLPILFLKPFTKKVFTTKKLESLFRILYLKTKGSSIFSKKT